MARKPKEFKESSQIANWFEKVVQFSPTDVERLKAASKRSGLTIDTILELSLTTYLLEEERVLAERGMSLTQEVAQLRAQAMSSLYRPFTQGMWEK